MEHKTSNLDPEDELAIIKEMIPMANNLPENLTTLSLMGLEEIHIRDIFSGKVAIVFEGIVHPITGQTIHVGPTRIELGQDGDDRHQEIFINSRPAEEFFDKPLPDFLQERDIDRLIDENETLRKQIIEYQARYDNTRIYSIELERKLIEEKDKQKN